MYEIRRLAVVLAAALLAPLAVRTALLAALTGSVDTTDVAGIGSDAGAALLFAALLIGSTRWLALVLAVLWAVAHYVQYETALALDSIASVLDLRFLGDRTFIGGSVLWVSNPALLALCVLGSAVLAFFGARRASLRAAFGVALVGALLLGTHALIGVRGAATNWRQTNFAHYNAQVVLRALVPAPGGPAGDPASALLRQLPELGADLEGTPRQSLPGGARNVIVVFLESVSGAYLPSVRDGQGVSAGLSMQRLDAIAGTGLSYSNFVAHQRRTSRGLYAALCGDLPNLLRGIPKMTAYVKAPRRRCLPRVLGDAGYETVFLQAAPLAFMLKDQFMPKAGFAQVYGHDWFEPGYANSVWGVDDRSFLEQSLRMVDTLNQGDDPWFLTLLSVGTHHPTILPDDFEPTTPLRFARAIHYLDLAIDDFVRELDARGVLDDTLLILTSDESRGVTARGLGPDSDETTRTLTHSWGYLVVRTPEGSRGPVDEPFALMDLPLSVLDYLGLADGGMHLYGRSVFREYATGRHLFFANANLNVAGAFAPDDQLFLCSADFRDCQAFGLEPRRLFSANRRPRPWSPAGRIVEDVARASAAVQGGGLRPDVFELVQKPRFEVDSVFEELVHGGEYLDLKRGQWIEVELEIDATSTGARPVLIDHRLSSDRGRLQNLRLEVAPGHRRVLRYTYVPEKDMSGVRTRSLARLQPSSTSATLEFRRARLTVHTVGERPPLGVQVHSNEHERIP